MIESTHFRECIHTHITLFLLLLLLFLREASFWTNFPSLGINKSAFIVDIDFVLFSTRPSLKGIQSF